MSIKGLYLPKNFNTSPKQISGYAPDPAKSGSSQISSRIWQMSVQLQYVQLITDKTNAADLWGHVFAIIVSVIWMKKIQNSLPCQKFCQKLANGDVRALSCTAAFL